MHGLRVISSPYALKDGDVRLFKASKNRSKRIHKKLVKRFGGEFKKVPAIYQMGDTIVAHPTMFNLIQREFANDDAKVRGNPLPFGLQSDLPVRTKSEVLGRFAERALSSYPPLAHYLDAV